jgi:hypothetical protein
MGRLSGASATIFLLASIASCSGRTRTENDYVRRDAGAQAGETSETGGASSGGNGSGGAGKGGVAGTGGAGSGSNGDGGGGADSGGGNAGMGGQPDVTGDLLYIKASNPDADDRFGGAVSLDENWLAIGATNESSRATGIDGDEVDDSEDGSGAVYLFSDEGTGWGQRAYVKASNTEAVDGFGAVVSLSGGTLAVGAPFEDALSTGVDGAQENGGANVGAVYVFSRDGDTWRQEAYVKASNAGNIDLFGTSLELEGDRLVVGAPWEDSAATTVNGEQANDSAQNSGAVYVFERETDGWAQVAYLKGSYSEANDEFGKAVATSGDTLAVGAPGESSSQLGVDAEPADALESDSGAVYVFERDGASYRQTALLKASNADAEDAFGGFLALDGDTLAVSAVGEATANGDGTTSNESLPDVGAVYVFERRAGSWAQAAYLKPTSPGTEYYFGRSLALSGDTLVVGALADSRTTRTGAVYVFKREGGSFRLDERLTAPNAELGDHIGSAVAVTPALLAIGADGEAGSVPGINGDSSNDDTPGAGAVFLHTRR